jgi:ubiquitin carboxyl-terminal hydrolase 14
MDVDEEVQSLPTGVVSDGMYKLMAVVTHKGRSADSGHYIGWGRQTDTDWLKFDDDVVSAVKTANVLDLAGGGDWHSSYINFYKRVDHGPDKKWDV